VQYWTWLTCHTVNRYRCSWRERLENGGLVGYMPLNLRLVFVYTRQNIGPNLTLHSCPPCNPFHLHIWTRVVKYLTVQRRKSNNIKGITLASMFRDDSQPWEASEGIITTYDAPVTPIPVKMNECFPRPLVLFI